MHFIFCSSLSLTLRSSRHFCIATKVNSYSCKPTRKLVLALCKMNRVIPFKRILITKNSLTLRLFFLLLNNEQQKKYETLATVRMFCLLTSKPPRMHSVIWVTFNPRETSILHCLVSLHSISILKFLSWFFPVFLYYYWILFFHFFFGLKFLIFILFYWRLQNGKQKITFPSSHDNLMARN